MKIAVYSYSATLPSQAGGNTRSFVLPHVCDVWDELAEKYPEHEFVVVGNMPSVYVTDPGKDMGQPKSDRVKYKITFNPACTIEDMAKLIMEEAPDLAIAAPGGNTIDWNPVATSMIAEVLEKNGIKSVAQRSFVSIGAFDKWRTQIMLRTKHINVSKGIYIHDEMFWIEEKDSTVANNVYKDYVLLRVRDMNYPVIIKDTLGSGSMGVTIVHNYEEAYKALTEKRNNGDVIVEELIEGVQFGTEIHGVPGNYCVLPPVIFSTNKDGITDPFQSVKLGPVTNEKYNIKKLQKMLLDMAEELQFYGITQVDLVYKDGEWYVIEINPRISGMSSTAAAMEQMDRLEMIIQSAIGMKKDYSNPDNLKYATNFKLVNPTEEIVKEMKEKYPCIVNSFASISPAFSYCEVVLGGFDDVDTLYKEVEKIVSEYQGVISPIALENLKILCESI